MQNHSIQSCRKDAVPYFLEFYAAELRSWLPYYYISFMQLQLIISVRVGTQLGQIFTSFSVTLFS